MILAGDIGGTKSTFMLFAGDRSNPRPTYRLSTLTRNVHSFKALLECFRSEALREGHKTEKLEAAVLAVAGAVVGDHMLSANLPWLVEKGTLAATFHLPQEKAVLLNDLAAAAAGVAHLKSEDFLRLNDGIAQPHAPMALIAAGTGLGEAVLFWDGHRYRVSPSEAGMTDFAPFNTREFTLLQSLRTVMPRVCTEEIVSGRGFRTIHETIFPQIHHECFDNPKEDSAVFITEQALAGTCTACKKTVQIWIEAYGSEAGNMALRILPFGGVYIAGGIALRILPLLKNGDFVSAFTDKMKLNNQLAKIPIHVILNEDTAVIGAAYEALALVEG